MSPLSLAHNFGIIRDMNLIKSAFRDRVKTGELI